MKQNFFRKNILQTKLKPTKISCVKKNFLSFFSEMEIPGKMFSCPYCENEMAKNTRLSHERPN